MVTGPGAGSQSAPGIAATMEMSDPPESCAAALVRAQGPLPLSELRFYSIRALTCFLNRFLIGNALVSAFHSASHF